jgi:GDP-4-dehydro-6-deoxy-D-mannose reductase
VLEALLAKATVKVSIRQDHARARPSDNQLLLGDRSKITDDVTWSPEIPLSRTLSDLLNYWRAVIADQ